MRQAPRTRGRRAGDSQEAGGGRVVTWPSDGPTAPIQTERTMKMDPLLWNGGHIRRFAVRHRRGKAVIEIRGPVRHLLSPRYWHSNGFWQAPIVRWRHAVRSRDQFKSADIVGWPLWSEGARKVGGY